MLQACGVKEVMVGPVRKPPVSLTARSFPAFIHLYSVISSWKIWRRLVPLSNFNFENRFEIVDDDSFALTFKDEVFDLLGSKSLRYVSEQHGQNPNNA